MEVRTTFGGEPDKFRDWAYWPRIFFRVSGTLIILSGISIPLIVALDPGGKNLLVSAAGLVVVFLTTVNSFFAWDQAWKTNYTTALMFENALITWRADLVRARAAPAPEQGIQIANEAFARFIDTATTLRSQNAAAYFAGVRPPQARPE